MKKFIIGFITGALLFGAFGAFAATYVANSVTYKVLVNGTEFTSDPPPLEVEGRTYLPLRAMGDAFGVPVNWNEELRQAEVGLSSADGFDPQAMLQQMVDQAKSSIASMTESMQDFMDINIEAQGNSIVYTYKYKVDVGDSSELKPLLEAGIEGQSSMFEMILQQLKAINLDSPSVIIKYLDMNGQEIYVKEFK